MIESIAETLQRTTLGDCRVGNRVNLERSLKLGDRLDGHLVAAHVDGVGRVRARTESPDQIVFEFEVAPELAPYIAEKGSVTVNGNQPDSDFSNRSHLFGRSYSSHPNSYDTVGKISW